MSAVADPATTEHAELIRVRGQVQGVGFRPTVWRLARRYVLRGWVANDGAGVNMHVCGTHDAVDAFVRALSDEAPPLARIESLERRGAVVLPPGVTFQIVASGSDGTVQTGVVPDAATCADCLREVLDPAARRFRYPFTNCTHCGPRLSIIEAIPYDRANTTMRSFPMCAACEAEYRDPADRRFHAQPIACPACGPHAWLERSDGAPIDLAALGARDAIEAVHPLLQQGQIVAVKGLGGFQLACDAGDEAAVQRLRALKGRACKPFALMARDLDVVRRHCAVSDAEAALLRASAAPIVIMDRRAGAESELADAVAPGLATLGMMLPNTPLHHLMLRAMDRPIVLTSGNRSDEPQCIHNDDARQRLGDIADVFLFHDRDIARRVDDSVQRQVAGAPRLLRRARGLAPGSLPLPPGFGGAPSVLALGGELKNTFCLLDAAGDRAHATVSHHMGDLEDAATFADFQSSLASYLRLFDHLPQVVAVDLHPDYLSSRVGRDLADTWALPLIGVQHHHAHVAACLAENGIALDAPPVLGVVLDGLGFGDEAEGAALWGGEFLAADYRTCTRLAHLMPVAMPGGVKAIQQPWRNTYAHLRAAMGWARLESSHGDLELCDFLAAQPRALLDGMIDGGVNSPLASSCGRLFDAVAAAAGVCRESAAYEGQAAIEFEALVDRNALDDEADDSAYPLAISRAAGGGLPVLDPAPMWQALLDDLKRATPLPLIAARFHQGLAIAIVRMVHSLVADPGETARLFTTVVLSGGVFQNRVLFEAVCRRLDALDLTVLSPHQLPANDGGLSLGQAVVAAARRMTQETSPCA